MQISNKAGVKYQQILPDGTVTYLFAESGEVNTNLITKSPQIIEYYTATNSPLNNAPSSGANLNYFILPLLLNFYRYYRFKTD